jgi:hypothetical protein
MSYTASSSLTSSPTTPSAGGLGMLRAPRTAPRLHTFLARRRLQSWVTAAMTRERTRGSASRRRGRRRRTPASVEGDSEGMCMTSLFFFITPVNKFWCAAKRIQPPRSHPEQRPADERDNRSRGAEPRFVCCFTWQSSSFDL